MSEILRHMMNLYDIVLYLFSFFIACISNELIVKFEIAINAFTVKNGMSSSSDMASSKSAVFLVASCGILSFAQFSEYVKSEKEKLLN